MLRPKSNCRASAPACHARQAGAPALQRLLLFIGLLLCLTSRLLLAQNAIELPQQKEKKKQEKVVAKAQEKIAQRANLEIRGNQAFDDKTLRSQLKEQIAT